MPVNYRSDYLSGRTIEDLISSKTVARGRVLSAPGDLSTARRVVGGWCRAVPSAVPPARCDNYRGGHHTVIVLLSAHHATPVLSV